MTKPKKIPRAIEIRLLDELKKINPDINKAIDSLIFANSRKTEAPEPKQEAKQEDSRELVEKLWPYLRQRVDARIDIAIEDAKRGWR